MCANSIAKMFLFKVEFIVLISILAVILLSSATLARLDERSETESLVEEKTSGHEIARASDVLKSYLKELDRYIAIAGRPR